MDVKEKTVYNDVRTMLHYYRALGIEQLPFDIKQPGQTKRLSVSDNPAALAALQRSAEKCIQCKLAGSRKNVVFGDGSSDAQIMFIGEAPGKEEDIQGLPFVGDAGMLLTRLIEKMGLKRSDVYIANIIKCRPPKNRDPESDEIESCIGYLERQIEIIRPEIIVTLGRISLQTLMQNTELKISAVRGNFMEYKQIPVMPTFHPAYLLRNPKDKWLTWSDAQKVMERIRA